jgi:hypothetical protein
MCYILPMSPGGDSVPHLENRTSNQVEPKIWEQEVQSFSVGDR